MTDVLIIGDTFRSPELRNEIPLAVPDPFVYLEHDGHKHVYVGSMEAARIRGLGLELTVHTLEEIGIDELRAQGFGYYELSREWVARSCLHVGLTSAVVPHTFPAGHLDRIRQEGIVLSVDQPTFDARRRVKSAPQLEGIRRAQRAAEAGLTTGIALLRSASNNDGTLWLDGKALTVERVKRAMGVTFAENGCTAEEFVVAPGPQGAAGHDMGHGPIPFGVPVVFDLWPRDDASSCFADMTRTIVVGPASDQVREWHRVTREALAVATAFVRAGVECRDVFDVVCDVYEAAGYPTQRTKEAGQVLNSGFFHGLGHGVGLEVHEGPSIGLLAAGPLLAGDVITLEPGAYDPAIGGVRLEDIVLVTEDGCELLTDFPYDLEV
ncbi:Xaa-Pro peptidase family protein [Gaiella sp.]|uniref:M24 family metallopeptidase n=1 Tax=Gaiella sp. TaxID=2663207 RepID=UPI00326613CB